MNFKWKMNKLLLLIMTTTTTTIITKKEFLDRNWYGINRVRRAEMNSLALFFKMTLDDTNSNEILYNRILNRIKETPKYDYESKKGTFAYFDKMDKEVKKILILGHFKIKFIKDYPKKTTYKKLTEIYKQDRQKFYIQLKNNREQFKNNWNKLPAELHQHIMSFYMNSSKKLLIFNNMIIRPIEMFKNLGVYISIKDYKTHMKTQVFKEMEDLTEGNNYNKRLVKSFKEHRTNRYLEEIIVSIIHNRFYEMFRIIPDDVLISNLLNSMLNSV